MSEPAFYFIAQQIPDLFRREPRNVGVFVTKGATIAARFLGEAEPGGALDRRKLRSLSCRDVYCQWVDYWRRLIRERSSDWKAKLLSTRLHYRVLEGGEVTDTGQDSAGDVANYLYSLLVSEGGLAEALGAPEESEAAMARLVEEVTERLETENIFAGMTSQSRHPVQRNTEVLGTTSRPHRPAFVQENGALYVMETIDFVPQAKDRAKDHAGWAAYMFNDIRRASTTLNRVFEGISIIRLQPEDEESPSVQYAMEVLQKESDKVVNWLAENERERFVEERIRVAELE